ncbi:Pass1-related protein [Collimonas arenae]|uniref:Pass1-related protein n=1 Tax=Collimonas arenae TaxID=279058 RepID=A0A0A1F6S3_9BURK|nr:cupin-like domain-containing protein [Collimonas arenae]AIY40413.1 Pass1-related protein [Collimonas arenae]
MSQALQSIPERFGVDDRTFMEEIAAQYKPVVLRGYVNDWPAVKLAKTSTEAVCNYLKKLDNGSDVDAIMTRPEAKGRIFYDEAMNGFNYVRNRLPVSAIIDQLARYRSFPNPPAVAAQSALIANCLPGFLDDNKLPVLGPEVIPRIWIGNAVTTPAHFDDAHNIACVVSGKRRFTLFPPEQIGNLYIGPVDFAPTGAPISMVSLSEPDFDKYPKFKNALAAAQVAELEPGDALYIPPLWWHHVESLQACNILVNYWWGGAVGTADSAHSGFDSLMLALLNLKRRAPAYRQAWAAVFNHYVFDENDDVATHIPAHRHGILGEMSVEQEQQVRNYLANKLKGR